MPDTHFLRRSFQHLPGISASKEAKLWDEGIADWDDLIHESPIQLDLYRKRGSALHSAVEASEEALANGDIAFFASRLPKREFYRIAASFPDRCVFLDIESTGLSTYYDHVTLVGWSLGGTYTALVDPDRIEPLVHILSEHPVVVTFNGSLFDLPFLTRRFEADWSGLVHVDLRYLAKRVELTGGQKKIEGEIGLTRDASLEGINGVDAVGLWFDYKEGDLNALRDLIRYNHADIEGMKRVFEEVIRRVSPQVGAWVTNGGLFQRSSICFRDADGAEIGDRSGANDARQSNGGNDGSSPSGSIRPDGANDTGRAEVIDTNVAVRERGPNGTNSIPIRPYTGTIGPRLALSDLCGAAAGLDRLTVVGIDLTGSERRKTGWAAATGRTLTMALVTSDDELLDRTLAAKPFLVSIDSPLSLPAGRTSEFDDDPGRATYGIVREAERLLRSRGIHVYPALLPSMQRLTRRGVELGTRLRKRGVPVIESYPGGAQDILGIPRKKTSLKHLVEGLRRFGYAGLGIHHCRRPVATCRRVPRRHRCPCHPSEPARPRAPQPRQSGWMDP